MVKVRPPAERLEACARVHAHLWRRGYPCPEPLVGPRLLDGVAVSIEAYVPAEPAPSRADAITMLAPPLAELVALAPFAASLPTLAPVPAWVGWNGDEGRLWPPPDDRDDDLNEMHEPAWIDGAAARASRRLDGSALPAVIGHVDWWGENFLWNHGALRAVLDWDSVGALPEAALAGVAAAIVAAPAPLPTVHESAEFLAVYQRACGRRFGQDEAEISWAAGAWTRLFDAKKESVDGAGPLQTRLAEEIEQRLRRAGA